MGTTRTRRAASLALLVATASGCAESAPVALSPTKAAKRGISVCWQEGDARGGGTNQLLRSALAKQLRAAGYAVVPRDCELRLSLSYTVEDGAIGLSFRTAHFDVRDRSRAVLLDRAFHFGSSDLPVLEPDRFAVVLVDAMNASPKVAGVVPPASARVGAPAAEKQPVSASPPPADAEASGAFDVQAAAKALDDAARSIHSCAGLAGAEGGHVTGHVTVQFSPNGTASLAKIDTPSLARTDAGACIATRFAQVRVPPFTGAAVTVGRAFDLE